MLLESRRSPTVGKKPPAFYSPWAKPCRRELRRTGAPERKYSRKNSRHVQVSIRHHTGPRGLPRWSRQPKLSRLVIQNVLYTSRNIAFSLYIYVSMYEPLVPSRAYIFVLRVPCNSVGILCSTASETYTRRRASKVAQLSPCPTDRHLKITSVLLRRP